MKFLFDEILLRFPEVRSDAFEDNHDLPYSLMHYVIWWLAALEPSNLTPEIINRVKDFSDWCISYPRGETAENDLYTIWTVAFYEDLFQHDVTRKIIPHLTSKEDLLKCKEYLLSWIEPAEFEAALREY